MATVKIKVGDNYEYEITEKTKDTTYVFTNEDAALGSVLNFKPISYTGNLIYAKNENDLLIYAKFGEGPDYKTSITTLKTISHIAMVITDLLQLTVPAFMNKLHTLMVLYQRLLKIQILADIFWAQKVQTNTPSLILTR